jgi:hypothetical protein
MSNARVYERVAPISRKHLTEPRDGRVPILRVTGLTTGEPVFSVSSIAGDHVSSLPTDPALERAVELVRPPWPIVGTNTRALLPKGVQTSRLNENTYNAFTTFLDRHGVRQQPGPGPYVEFVNHPLWTDERGAWFQGDFPPRSEMWLPTESGQVKVEVGHLATAGLRLMLASTFDNRASIS